jgi:hypothetical protein
MRGLRMSWVVAGLALLLGLGRAEAMRVHVIPEHPTATDSLKIVVEGDLEGCLVSFSAPQVLGSVITIHFFPVGRPNGPDCNGAWASALDLSPLPAGSYDVRVDDSGTILAAGSVVIAPDASGFQGEVTVSPRLPTSHDLVQLQVAIPPCALEVSPPYIAGDRVVVRLEAAGVGLCPPPPVAPAQFSIGPLPAGSYTALYVLNGVTTVTQSFSVIAPALELDLLQKRFRATLQRGAPGTAVATAVRLTEESGYFWFFDRDNAEVTLKMLDGRSVNGHFWVYAASMTDLPFTLTITDLASPGCDLGHCAVQTYSSPAGKNTNFLDINGF